MLQEIDHIYKYIIVENNLSTLIEQTPLKKELNRLKQMNQLGLIAREFHLAKHTKYEHHLGVYFLINKLFNIAKDNISSSAGIKDNTLKLAALIHGIGHLPFSFPTERAVLLAASMDKNIYEAVESRILLVANVVCNNCSRVANKHKCFRNIVRDKRTFDLFRWFSASKILSIRHELEQAASGITNFNIEELCKYLVCRKNIGNELLFALDRLDCIIRDLFYVGTINIDINLEHYLRNIYIDSEKKLTLPKEWEGIVSLENYLEDNVYNSKMVNAYSGVFVKTVAQNLLEGKIKLKSLLQVSNAQLIHQVRNRPIAVDKKNSRLSILFKAIRGTNTFKFIQILFIRRRMF